MRFPSVSFLSDYGYADEFVGVVKSVIYGIAPSVRIVDLTHGVAPYDVRGGSLALARACQYLNPGVVLAVVDPGVGSDRRAVAIEVGEGSSVLLGPDNGVLAPAVAMVGGPSAAFDISESPKRIAGIGATFDGRDLFGPVAAHLCLGEPLQAVGEEIDPNLLTPMTIGVSHSSGDRLICEVLWVDRFGNAQLNVDPEQLSERRWTARIADKSRPARSVSHFDELGDEELGLVTDSSGMIALVMRQRSVSRALGLASGTEITFEPAGGQPLTTPVEIIQKDAK